VFDDVELMICGSGGGTTGPQGRVPFVGGVDDLVHATEPTGGNDLTASERAVGSLRTLVEAEIKLVIRSVES